MSGLSERLQSIVARLDLLGVARTADDIRDVAEALTARDRDRSSEAGTAVARAIERLSMARIRLRRAGFARFDEDLGPLLDELAQTLRSASCR